MKVISVIILCLVLKAKASFFDDFKGAMSSVENAFGKLLNDVVTDVKTTVHCTILAMEQVLAINGIIPEPLPNKECANDENSNVVTRKDNHDFYSAKDIANEITSSISKVNQTLSHILDNNGHERLEDVRRALKNESNRLTEVSFLLRKELEKISHTMRKHFQNIDLNSDKTSLESIWTDMKLLYEVEKNNTNVSEEIGQVLNEALNVLHLDTAGGIKSDEQKINAIMRELEQESNDKNDRNITKHELSELKEKQTTVQSSLENKLKVGVIPKNFKDVAADILNKNNKISKEVHNTVTKNSIKTSNFVSRTLSNKKPLTKNDGTKRPNIDSDVHSPFGETNSDDVSKGIDDAMNILKDSAQTQALLDNLFAKEHGANAFENSNLFNFEK